MKVICILYILYIVMHVNGGSTVTTVEHNSLEQCNHARSVFYDQYRKSGASGLEVAYCVEK